MADGIELEQLADLVQAMRKAQRRYRDTRTIPDLRRSQALEKKVDDAVHVILEYREQPLFGPTWDDRH